MLSFITYQRWAAEVKGLDAFPRDTWPDNIPLLYYSFHVMVGLGTIFIAVMGLSVLALWRGILYRSKPLLWALMLMLPFPPPPPHPCVVIPSRAATNWPSAPPRMARSNYG